MLKYEKMILLSDMDGTLLDSDSEISPMNKKAIYDFVSQGGLFGVATGRSPLNAKPYLHGVVINIPCIFYNGCALYDFAEERFLELCKLPGEKLTSYLKSSMSEFENVIIHMYSADTNYIITPETSIDEDTVSNHQPYELCQLDDLADEEWIKILCSGKKEDLLAMENKLKDFDLQKEINWVFSSEKYLEFLPLHATKGSMLSRLRDIVGADYKIYAMGDYYNDMEMLAEADVGIATANAPAGVKEAADVITVSNDESAVADAIYNMIAK